MELVDDFADWEDQRGQREDERQRQIPGYANRQWVLSLEAHEFAMTPRCPNCRAACDIYSPGIGKMDIYLDAGTNHLHRCGRNLL